MVGNAQEEKTNLSTTLGAIWQAQVDNFREFGELDIVQNNKGTIDSGHRAILW